MVGGIIIAVVLVVVIPVGVLVSAGLVTFLLGSALDDHGRRRAGDSELVETNY